MAKKAARRGGSRRSAKAKDAAFEVEDPADSGAAPLGLEAGLVLITFVALLVGLIVAQMQLSSQFDAGWLF